MGSIGVDVKNFLQILIATALALVFSTRSFAWSCAPQEWHAGDTLDQHIARIGRGWIGDSAFVVRARVTSLGLSYSSSHHRFASVNLNVEKTYVGSKQKYLKVFLNHGVVAGQELIVYARKESDEQIARRKLSARLWDRPRGEDKPIALETTDMFAADGNCSDTTVASTKKEFLSHVAFLEKLPPPNSGGEIEVVCAVSGATYFDWGRIACPAKLARNGQVIGDDVPKEVHTFSNLPAGTYRLLTTPQGGKSVTCQKGGIDVTCDAITVVDRGVRSYGITYKNAGTLDLVVVDGLSQTLTSPLLLRFRSLVGPLPGKTPNEKQTQWDLVMRPMGFPESKRDGETLQYYRAQLPPGRYSVQYVKQTMEKKEISKDHAEHLATQEILLDTNPRVVEVGAGRVELRLELPRHIVQHKVTIVSDLLRQATAYASANFLYGEIGKPYGQREAQYFGSSGNEMYLSVLTGQSVLLSWRTAPPANQAESKKLVVTKNRTYSLLELQRMKDE
jgi:hypothetical protein